MIEYDTYKAVYCGLCKQLGKAFGPFSRMTLSYDFAFLSLLSLGVAEECRGFKREPCAANPLKKKALSLCLRGFCFFGKRSNADALLQGEGQLSGRRCRG